MVKRKAGANSKRQYGRGATQMLDASAAQAGLDESSASSMEMIGALLKYLETEATLCEGTVSHYVQCAKVAIERVLGQGQEAAIAAAVSSARDSLDDRQGTPEPARGASRKIKDPALVELGDVFSHLRWKFIEKGDPLDLLLALYIVVMPRIGLRPVEMTWAEWDGNALYTHSAKRAGRPKRYVPTEHWPPVYRAALGLFFKLIPRGLDDAEFEMWRNLLASRLARASKWTRAKRRLSLYFARHIAIASWKGAGITPELIAELAGHAGLKSQHFYASGRSGYGARYVFLDAAEGQALLETRKASVSEQVDEVGKKVDAAPPNDHTAPAVEDLASSGEEDAAEVPREPEVKFVWEEMPTPGLKEVPRSREEGERLWAAEMRRKEAEWARLENDLARIRRDRMAPGMQNDEPDGPDQEDGHHEDTQRNRGKLK